MNRPASKYFSALSNPTRLAIILSLLKGEKCVKELVKELRVEQSVVSHNIRQLAEAGLLKQRREAKFVFVSLTDKAYPLLKLLRGQDALKRGVETSLDDTVLGLKKLADLIPLPVLIHRGVRIEFANRAAIRLFFGGASGGRAMMGRVLMDLLTPEGKAKLIKRQERLRAGESLPTEEYTIMRDDGSQLRVEANMVLVRMDGGYGFFTVARDVTAERERERIQTEAAARFRGILEATSYGVVVLDRDDRIAYINPRLAAMTGGRPADYIGRSPAEIMTGETFALISKKIGQRRKGVAETYDLDMKFRDGRVLRTTCTSNPIFDKQGNYDGLVNIIIATRGDEPDKKP